MLFVSPDLRIITPTGARRAQDWMSRFQAYTGGLIAEALIREFQVPMIDRCMDTMDLWYGSALMMIWMLTEGPPGSRDYFSRGWCVAQRSLSLCARVDAVLEVALESRSR